MSHIPAESMCWAYVKSEIALLCLETGRDPSLPWSFNAGMLDSLGLSWYSRSHFCLSIPRVHTSLESTHFWKNFEHEEWSSMYEWKISFSWFCHSFSSTLDPLFVYLLLLQEITHSDPSVPGQLRLPVTRCHTRVKQKFVFQGFQGNFSLEGRSKWYDTIRGGAHYMRRGHTPSVCTHFSPYREPSCDRLGVHCVLHAHVWERAREGSRVLWGPFVCGLCKWEKENPRQ